MVLGLMRQFEEGEPATTDTDGCPNSPILVVRKLTKAYGTGPRSTRVLADVTFDVKASELVCVVGPSGVGKTTLLRCLAGLVRPSTGQIFLAGKPVEKPPPNLALVFQDYSRSLMPWMTVERNVGLPLLAGCTRTERKLRVQDALDVVGLADRQSAYPWELSGGMQQRVAIARGLAYRPDVLLMDEPFAAVDAQTRTELEDLMVRIQREFGLTVVFVTHDIDEAVYLGNRVVVMSGAPSRVSEIVAVDLPAQRDQVATKALPRFAELRGHLFNLIREAKTISAEPSSNRAHDDLS